MISITPRKRADRSTAEFVLSGVGRLYTKIFKFSINENLPDTGCESVRLLLMRFQVCVVLSALSGGINYMKKQSMLAGLTLVGHLL